METNLSKYSKSRKTSALVVAMGFVSIMWVSIAHSAQLIWTGDAEKGDLSQYKTKIYDAGVYGFIDVVTAPEPVRSGNYAVRTLVTGGTKQKRAEVVTNLAGGGNMKFLWDGPEYWIGFSLYYKEWKADGNTFVQVHAPNEEAGAVCDMAGNAFTIAPLGDGGKDANGFPIENELMAKGLDNPTGISSGNGAFSNNINMWRTPIATGVWHDYVVRFKLSTKGEGFYEIWYNGKKVYSKLNLYNVNWKDSCGNLIPADKRMHNGLHLGIYAGVENQYRRIYFDEVRIAEGTNGYDLVAPGGSTLVPPIAPTGLSIKVE